MKKLKVGDKIFTIPRWKRAVIKVGSALVAPEGKRISSRYMLEIASFITELHNRGKEVILVSSGAVAAGRSTQTGLANKKLSIRQKQALAAIGQPLLMSHWSRFFDFPCAQLLLTYQGIYERQRYINAKNTIIELLNRKTLPIVNENDTVVTDELKVGDNDNLAAHVAVLSDADVLIIFSDVDGLYTANPRTHPDAVLIPVVEKIDKSIYSLAGDASNHIATGGMITKIQAADKATSRGINSIILNGTKRSSLEKLLENELNGTIFLKKDSPMNAKKHWMMHTIPCAGKLFVDAGAKKALVEKGASLLPSGIIRIQGEFGSGDAVEIYANDECIAKGITQYSSLHLGLILGKKSSEIEETLGFILSNEIIRRDDLVLVRDC